MVISVCNEKGGSGKSTIVLNIASYLGLQGKNVLVIDSDPQNSINVFTEIRVDKKKKELFSSISKVGMSLKETISVMKDKFDYIIIDTGGRDSKEMRIAMLGSDKLIIPTIPSQLDLSVFINMINIFETCINYSVNLFGYVLINKITTNPFLRNKETEEIRNFIVELLSKKSNIILLENMVSERLVFRKSIMEGLSIFEFNDYKAQNEFKEFLDEINLI